MLLRTIMFIWVVSMAIAIAFVATPAYPWDLRNAGLEEVEPDAVYTLSTRGTDVRVYEWTPETDPHMTCIAMFASAGPVGMQCWEKQ